MVVLPHRSCQCVLLHTSIHYGSLTTQKSVLLIFSYLMSDKMDLYVNLCAVFSMHNACCEINKKKPNTLTFTMTIFTVLCKEPWCSLFKRRWVQFLVIVLRTGFQVCTLLKASKKSDSKISPTRCWKRDLSFVRCSPHMHVQREKIMHNVLSNLLLFF